MPPLRRQWQEEGEVKEAAANVLRVRARELTIPEAGENGIRERTDLAEL